MWSPLLIVALVGSSFALNTKEPPPPIPKTRSEPSERWLNVRLNHFSAFNNDTFPMRFYYNGEFAKEQGNNIVIYVGGEWAISPGWVTGGLPHEIASVIQAGVFYTEHRYYGLTRPTADTSVDNLRFLSVDQALADLAQFIEYVKSDEFEKGLYSGGKVVLVGCSYSGSMVTWMRLAYPHLVDAAFSDSGPLHAQEDFPEYLEVITEALRSQGSEECVDSISEAMNKLVTMLEDQSGAATVSELFNTCSEIQFSMPMDVATFYWYGITETFASLVQYATPGDIPKACDTLTEDTISDPVQRLAKWINSQSSKCIETRYSEVVAAHTNTSYESPEVIMRLWTYQTCVEYGWYQTTNSENQPFLSVVPLEYFHQMCQDFFSANFNQSLLQSGIKRTNLLFAGLTHLPDNLVSVSGSHDPWSPMAPKESHETPLAPVIVVPGVSHCRAIRPTGESETEELENAKWEVINTISEYITGTRASSGAVISASILLLAIIVPVNLF